MDRSASRPRKAEAIFSATIGLLGERGYDALTIEAIAAAAGVNKTTIYRTWSTKDEVLADSLLSAPELRFEVVDTGSLRTDLIALATQIGQLLAEPATRRVITAVVAALPDRPATADAVRVFFADRLAREQAVFERARHRGELDADPEMVMDLLGGGLWFHTLIRTGTADDDYIKRLVDTVLCGASAQRPNTADTEIATT